MMMEEERTNGKQDWKRIADLMRILSTNSPTAVNDRIILEMYRSFTQLLNKCLREYSDQDLDSRTDLQDVVQVIDDCVLPFSKRFISYSNSEVSQETWNILATTLQYITSESLVCDYISESFEDHVKTIETGSLNHFKCNILININNICMHMRDILSTAFPGYNNQSEFFKMALVSTKNVNGNYLLKKINKVGKVVWIEAFHPIFLGYPPKKKGVKEWKARSKIAHHELKCSVCMDDHERPLREMIVVSACSHLLCISCANSWFDRKMKYECPLCRTESTECIRGSGYNPLMSRLFSAPSNI